MKPLARWIIGNVHPVGFDILEEAVKRFRGVYQQRFDLLISYNSLSDEQIGRVNELGVPTAQQGSFGVPKPGKLPAWKLYPPRLRPAAHELIMDNDLIVCQPCPQIEEFLAESDRFISTVAIHRAYGAFDSLVPEIKLNSGLVGLPPNYDYESDLLRICTQTGFSGWETHFDEQGLVAACLATKKLSLIPFSIRCDDLLMTGAYGYHFIGGNKGDRSFYRLLKGVQML